MFLELISKVELSLEKHKSRVSKYIFRYK